MLFPRKAFILAAGLGTRLRPLTLETPKPLLPLWNRPLLEYTLEMLAGWGVRDVLLNLHHAPGPLLRHLATHPHPPLQISAVFEPVILGTGGALQNARWFLDGPFWLINGDILAAVDPAPLLRVWKQKKPLAACWLTESAGPRTVRCENGWIRSFHDPQQGHATFCGLHLLDERILPFLAPAGFDTIIAAYERAMNQGQQIAGVCIPNAIWADIGTPRQYLQAHWDSAEQLGHSGETVTLPAVIAFSAPERSRLNIPELDPIEILPPRGSQREFFRWRVNGRSVIVIRWSPERPENRLYARHTRFLAALHLPVPRLIAEHPREHLLVIEDLPGGTLQERRDLFSPRQLRLVYQRLLEITLQLHLRGLTAARRRKLPLMNSFDDGIYAWEHEYFITHVLRPLGRASQRQTEAVLRELQQVARLLANSPQALIHRDWQSSNILFGGTEPVMIDYQGMRRGPAAYDLASLLCDPYMNLPSSLQQSLLAYYCRKHPDGRQIAAAFPAAAIQRLCQAMGAYAVLSQKPGMESFARHLPVAAAQLRRALRILRLPALESAMTAPAFLPPKKASPQ